MFTLSIYDAMYELHTNDQVFSSGVMLGWQVSERTMLRQD